MLALWRFVYTKDETVRLSLPTMPKYMIPLATKLLAKAHFLYVSSAARGQGMGRHTEAEVMEIGVKDLKTMSIFLGIGYITYCT